MEGNALALFIPWGFITWAKGTVGVRCLGLHLPNVMAEPTRPGNPPLTEAATLTELKKEARDEVTKAN